MTRIVYAAPDYVPPRGVEVLPIDAHPAIVEDRQRQFSPVTAKQRAPYTWKKEPRRGQLTLDIIEYLRRVGGATVRELAEKVGGKPSNITRIMKHHVDIFEPLDEREPAQPNQWLSVTVWGLVDE